MAGGRRVDREIADLKLGHAIPQGGRADHGRAVGELDQAGQPYRWPC